LLVVFLALFVFIFLRRRRRRQQLQGPSNPPLRPNTHELITQHNAHELITTHNVPEMEGQNVWGIKKFIRGFSISSRPKGQKRDIHELDSVIEVGPMKSREARPSEPETSVAPSSPPLPYLRTTSPQPNKSDLQNALSNN
jgi:hypothetical protein